MRYILLIKVNGLVVARVEVYPRSEEEEPILRAIVGGENVAFELTEVPESESMWAAGEVCSERYQQSLLDDDHDEH